FAFAALKEDGSVVTWGNSYSGGDSSTVTSQLASGVINISSPFDPIGLIVAENSPTNIAIGTFSSVDQDTGDTFTYSLVSGTGSTDNDSFTINSNQLLINASPDFEAKSSYSIRICTTDQTNSSYEKAFTIKITDVNETPTLQAVTPANLINTAANDTFTDITDTLVGADQDIGTTLVYGITDGNVTENTSTLDGNYGTLSLNTETGAYTYTPHATAINALTTNASDNFTFTVSDGDLSATQPFAINITDANDTPTTTVVDTNDTPPTTVVDAKLINSTNDIFKIDASEFTKVNIKIKIKGRSSKLVNEFGVFSVDDSLGTIDGIAPDAAGYQEKALSRAKTIFSVIANNPTGFNPEDLSRILDLQGGTQLRFYLKSQGNIIFSSTTTQKITSQSEGGFTLGWKDGSRGNSVFDDLQVNIQQTDEQLPIGTSLQGESQGEALDLRNFGTDSLISGTFIVNREASYNNFVGFYKVTNTDGGIDTNGDGTADILPGQAGYVQAAINSRVTDIGLSVGNQGTGNYNGNFQGGGIYVPFLIVDGKVDALLDSNSSNDPTVYFTFLGANADKTQHVKMLGDNVFGFEDLSGGGDKDYNDVIVKINLTHNIA
ncbi:MAG: DUF4114 domain-containing protein, partial [Nostoc sp.]|uniref:DUF4114 domain-containing protein n=1 Tax=Nostoc sp. TaxID=1180 RepID=UPI002FF78D7D